MSVPGQNIGKYMPEEEINAVLSLFRYFMRWTWLFLLVTVATVKALGQLGDLTDADHNGSSTELRINGPGYFIVRDPSTGVEAATRLGDFTSDINGYLVKCSGMRLQGARGPDLTQIGDLKINDIVGAPPIQSFTIHSDGKVMVDYCNGSQGCAGQIRLQNFSNTSKLGHYVYGCGQINADAGPLPDPVQPGDSGLGTIVSGGVEVPDPILSLKRIEPAAPGWAQGVLTDTIVQTDLAIEGRGYFVLRDVKDNTLYATRAGVGYFDANGYLINYAGMRVQGRTNSDPHGIGDIRLSTDGTPWENSGTRIWGYVIDLSGLINFVLSDGTCHDGGQILLVDCAHPEQLVKTNFAMCALATNAGPWLPPAPPGTANRGWVVSGTVEAGQIDEAILDARQRLNFFLQGSITPTENPTELAINGSGFFTVRDPVQNICYATRNGKFRLDGAAYLVDLNGYRVQGLADAAFSTVGDLKVDASGAPASAAPNASMVAFVIGPEGSVSVLLSDGTYYKRGQVLLQQYRDPQALMPGNGCLYSNVTVALPLFERGYPGACGLGMIVNGCLENPFTLPAIQLPPKQGFRLVATGLLGSRTVEVSDDLVHWSEFGQMNGSIMQEGELYDTNNPASAGRFYRFR